MKKIVLILSSFFVFNLIISAQNSWIPRSSMDDQGRYAAVCFVINDKAYVGLGQAPDGTNLKDFWEYNPLTDSWTKKANYPGTGSYAASAFVINGKGYVCLGAANPSTNANDLWEYTPSSNTWLKKSDFPGTARYGACSFVIGDTAFVGTGSYGDPNEYMFDMWMYVPATNSWTHTANFPGGKRLHATAFSYNNYGYVGTGLYNSSTTSNDLWRYDKSNNSWTRVSNMPGTPRMGIVNFILNQKVCLGSGYDLSIEHNDFYEYDPVSDSWSPFPVLTVNPPSRHAGVGFAIGNTGYLATGNTIIKGLLPDLWAYGIEKDSTDLPNSPVIRCYNDPPIVLNAGDDFAEYLWSTGETTSTIHVTEAGWYYVKVATMIGIQLSDSVEVKVDRPLINLGPDLNICGTKSVLLDPEGEGEFSSYLWNTPGEILNSQNITATESGVYTVETTDIYGCRAQDTVKLTFIDKPKLDLSKLDTLFCGTKSAELELSADKGNYTLERTDNHGTFTELNAIVPDYGSYSFKFTSTDSAGCFSDTTFKVGFYKIPTVNLSIDSLTCYHYNLDVKYVGDVEVDTSHFTWIFGGDTIAEGVGLASQTVALGINKAKRDLTLKVTQDGCSNSDTIRDIKVIPNLDLHIADSVICVTSNAEFIAENTETVTYYWDYGDGSKERSDSHTSHLYNSTGYYNVSLKVTTDKGCTNEVRIDSMVYVAPIPTAGFSLNPGKCLSLGNHEISYVGTGDLYDTYNWDLSAFDPEEIVQNPVNTQGPFVFNLKNKPQAPVKLSVISKYGCQSDTVQITVKRIPVFSMNVYNNKGCIPLETSFEGIINDLVDQLFFTWDFGDGTKDYGDQTSHFYRIANQKYDISLVARSGLSGCSDTLRIDTLVFVYPKPEAEFSVDHSIVYNDKPDIQFLNQSAGATDYVWNFGDGTTSIEVNPLHKYQSMGYHNALLQAYNDYNCMDSISSQVLVAFAKIFAPNAFSPNAPNPVDREFLLGQEAIKQEGYHLVILSRWDDIVFETKNEIIGWNGRMKNGNYAPAGTYIWILDFIDFLGRSHRQIGTVTLIF